MATAAPLPSPTRLWLPKRLLVTKSSLGWDHGRAIASRAGDLGVEVVELPSELLLPVVLVPAASLPPEVVHPATSRAPARTTIAARFTAVPGVGATRRGGRGRARRRR